MRKVSFGVLVVLLAGFWMMPGTASSHREAPLISMDPAADNTDLYAFVSPDDPTTVTLIANFIPFESPQGGPNFYRLDDNVRYNIKIDNNGDAKEDLTFRIRSSTTVRNNKTFLYNTGPITTGVTDPNLNIVQTYTLQQINGDPDTGTVAYTAGPMPTDVINVGFRSTPAGNGLAGAVQQFSTPYGPGRVYVGQRDDPFFVDLGAVFDLLNIRRLPGDQGGGVDYVAGYNVHTLAIQLPIKALTRNNSQPSAASDPNAVIGIWSTAERQVTTTRTTGGSTSTGSWVQVSRLGMPLVNEVVIDLARKDAFNAIPPTSDAVALDRVTDPEFSKLVTAIYGVPAPPAPRNDLVTIFLTGLAGLNQPANVTPSEMLRLNVAIPPSANPSALGVLGGDSQGFPNGRRLADDATDVVIRAAMGATPLTPQFNVAPNNRLGDGVDRNDKPFLTSFPYVAPPWPGDLNYVASPATGTPQ